MRLVWLLLMTVCLSFPLMGSGQIHLSQSVWQSLNPLVSANEDDFILLDLLFDRLLAVDDKGRFQPMMAESYEILDGGRRVNLKLRENLKWHDGTAITADDLVATWKLLRRPEVWRLMDNVGVRTLDAVEKVDPLRVRIRLASPRGTLLADLSNFMPVPKRHYEKLGSDPMSSPLNLNPVGSGPYRLVSPASSHLIHLERWKEYSGAYPGKSPGFKFYILSDPNSPIKSTWKGLISGDLHYSQIGSLKHYLLRKGAIGEGKFRGFNVPTGNYDTLWFNCDAHKPLSDVRLRQAMSELIPWKQLLAGQTFFPSRWATSLWPPEMWSHNPVSRRLPDPARAEVLLDRTEWRKGEDGIRRNARGEPLKLVFYVPGKPGFGDMGVPLQQNALTVGIQIQLIRASHEEILARTVKGDGDIWTYAWVTGLDPDLESPLFTSEGLGGQNICRYRNPEVDRLFYEGRHTLDLDRRKAIYRRIDEIIREECPAIPLTYGYTLSAAPIKLKNVRFDFLGRTYGFIPGMRGWELD